MAAKKCPSFEIDFVLLKRYRVTQKLGGGSFGKVYEVKDESSGQMHALKTEIAGTSNSVLKVEAAIMQSFQPKHQHFARLIEAGKYENMNYIVMTVLGDSLSELMSTRSEMRFQLETVIRIGAQVLRALNDLHELGYLHRDVKPSNLAIGRPPHHRQIYIFDFGLSRKFIDKGKRIKPRHRAPFRGTTRYATINAHQNIEQGPHDDLESLIYALIEIYHGSLPWSDITNENEVFFQKLHTSQDALFCGFPKQMRKVYNTVRKYTNESIIDYKYMHRQFDQMMRELKIDVNDPFEWER